MSNWIRRTPSIARSSAVRSPSTIAIRRDVTARSASPAVVAWRISSSGPSNRRMAGSSCSGFRAAVMVPVSLGGPDPTGPGHSGSVHRTGPDSDPGRLRLAPAQFPGGGFVGRDGGGMLIAKGGDPRLDVLTLILVGRCLELSLGRPPFPQDLVDGSCLHHPCPQEMGPRNGAILRLDRNM